MILIPGLPGLGRAAHHMLCGLTQICEGLNEGKPHEEAEISIRGSAHQVTAKNNHRAQRENRG